MRPSRSRNQTTGTLFASFSCDRSCSLAQSIISCRCMQSSVALAYARVLLSYFLPSCCRLSGIEWYPFRASRFDHFQIVSFPFHNDIRSLGFLVVADVWTRAAGSSVARCLVIPGRFHDYETNGTRDSIVELSSVLAYFYDLRGVSV